MEIVKTVEAPEMEGAVHETGAGTVFSSNAKGEEGYQPETRQKRGEAVYSNAEVEGAEGEEKGKEGEKIIAQKGAEPTDWQKQWKEKFPEFEDDEKLKSSFNEYKTKAEQADELQKKYADLETKSKLSPKLQRIKDVMEVLEKDGKDFDENTLAFINKDYSKIKDQRKLLEEDMRDKNPKWTDIEIEVALEKEYLLNEWGTEKDEVGDDIEGSKNKVQQAMEAKMSRDAQEAVNRLTEKQKGLFIKVEPDEKEKEAQVLAQKQRAEYIEKRATEISKSKSKLSYEFSDDEIKQMTGGKNKLSPIEFEPTDAERETATKMFKSFATNANTEQWQPFLDKEGKFTETSDEQAYQTILNGLVFERAIKGTAVNQFQKGRELEIKNSKKADAFQRRDGAPTKSDNATKSYLKIR